MVFREREEASSGLLFHLGDCSHYSKELVCNAFVDITFTFFPLFFFSTCLTTSWPICLNLVQTTQIYLKFQLARTELSHEVSLTISEPVHKHLIRLMCGFAFLLELSEKRRGTLVPAL